MSKTRIFFKVFLITLLLGIVIGCGFVACSFIGMTTFDADFDITSFNLPYTTTIVSVDSNGTEHVIDKIYDENRQWVDFENMPQALKDAIVCIEDERFYYHNGVDFIGTSKAVVKYLTGKRNAPGGSTITQQLVKNLTDDTEKVWQRKVTEILRAMNVENNSSKEEILEMYLNTVYFGNGCYGVKSASKVYFDKPPQDLTPLECASIAGLTQSPENYNPFKEECRDAFVKRRNMVLDKMLEFEKLSLEEYNNYIGIDTEFAQHSSSSDKSGSYFIQKLIEDVKSDLQNEYGLSRTESENYLKKGGLKIYATVDNTVQSAIDSVYQTRSSESNDPQSAIVVIDPYTGDIKGMAGGFGNPGSVTRNRVYDDPRQPGSAIKPLSVYSPAIEKGLITPSTMIDDTSYKTPDGTTIKNYDNIYSGKITVRYALLRSKNPPAVRILDELGINNSYNFLKDNLNISTLDERDKAHSPLALGGLTYGVRVDELTAAYSPFVNGGTYYEPHTYSHVVDSHGKVILDNRSSGKRAMSESTAFIMNSLLQGVVNSPSGTAYRIAKIPGVLTGGKTGTTDDDADRWFVGITPHYVAAIWYGYDNRNTVYASSNPCVKLWLEIMTKVYSKMPESEKSKQFFHDSIPLDVRTVSVCASTGLLPASDCVTINEYFTNNNVPTILCNGHGELETDDEETSEEGQTSEEGNDYGESDNSSGNSNSTSSNSNTSSSGSSTQSGSTNNLSSNTGIEN